LYFDKKAVAKTNTMENLYDIFLRHPKVITDSRAIETDCLFFALKGERFNGNKFAAAALEQGAAYAIIDEEEYATSDRCILVENVLETLQELAAYHRQKFYIPVLGITGSNGKTTTKELINAVLSSHYPTHCTKGNFNNHIGVPLTLLAMPEGTEVAIIEMGANHVGEIDFLSKIADPTHGLITNIGSAHLEGFGGIEGVKKGKSELYKYLEQKKGIVFINLDEPFLNDLAANNFSKIYYQESDKIDLESVVYETKLVRSNPFIKAAFYGSPTTMIEVQSQIIGHYNFNNIMTAIAVGRYFKVPAEKIKAAIENYVPSNNRSQIVKKGSNTYILDAYNANPTSIKNALEHFDSMEADSKIAILGDMLEMGNYSAAKHQEIYEQALACGFERLILVGKEFMELDVTEEVLQFLKVEDLKKWLDAQHFENTHFLVKGSRGIRLEKVV
jgi:UDP-N-acetylmuramoyl-tripeptide--D-alanyl-D-alanine ligase